MYDNGAWTKIHLIIDIVSSVESPEDKFNLSHYVWNQNVNLIVLNLFV